VQELLNNAKKHSQASTVSITITSVGNDLLVIYRDDGIGFQSHPNEEDSEIGSSGTGMEQMKNRILSLEGKWEMGMGMENGVYLTVTIPMRKVA
jgi:two-component system sensor histidine kinase ComP